MSDQVVRVDEGIEFFGSQVRNNPQDALSYVMRATLWQDRNEIVKALSDYGEAIRLSADDGWIFNDRGIEWTQQKDHDEALADFNQALRLQPHCAKIDNNLGTVWRIKRVYDEALADLSHAVELYPEYAATYDNRGLKWADTKRHYKAIADSNEAIRDTKYRDPKKAVESATKACELTDWHEAHDLGGLAAVYAETENVAAALKWQSKVIELMTESQKGEIDHVLVLHRTAAVAPAVTFLQCVR
jgi:Tfp pilus assembly protein PilF